MTYDSTVLRLLGITLALAALVLPVSPALGAGWSGSVVMTRQLDQVYEEPGNASRSSDYERTSVFSDGTDAGTWGSTFGRVVNSVDAYGGCGPDGTEGPSRMELVTQGSGPATLRFYVNGDSYDGGAFIDGAVPATRTTSCAGTSVEETTNGAFSTGIGNSGSPEPLPAGSTARVLRGSRAWDAGNASGPDAHAITWSVTRDPDADHDGFPDWSDDCPRDFATPDSPNGCPTKPACRDGFDTDRDGTTDYPSDPDCTSADDTTEGESTVACPSPSRRPVAVGDRWTLDAGDALDANVLMNDRAFDCGPLRARVIRISFAGREWSGLDRDGGFLYTAGPGIARVLVKRITYVAINSRGAVSRPAVATVTIRSRRGARSPLGGSTTPRAAAAAAGTPEWVGPSASGSLCFGFGLQSKCFTMLSVARTYELNASTPWYDLAGAAKACRRFSFSPQKIAVSCAYAVLKFGIDKVWDKGLVSNAVRFGDCVMFRVSRQRSLLHPLEGEWGPPEYHPTDSLVAPYDASRPQTSGYGTWPKRVFTTARWRVPIFCDAQGKVWVQQWTPLSDAP